MPENDERVGPLIREAVLPRLRHLAVGPRGRDNVQARLGRILFTGRWLESRNVCGGKGPT